MIPFDQRAEELAAGLAAQAGIALENALLYDEIRKLFEGFVNASVTAIESRDPTTSGHSRRVATLTVGAGQEGRRDRPTARSRDVQLHAHQDLQQIEYAGVLHDFGKVGVREQVLVKAKKLYEEDRRVDRACASRTSRRRSRWSTPSASCGSRWSWPRAICRGASPRSTPS